jgi:hypothetical protein
VLKLSARSFTTARSSAALTLTVPDFSIASVCRPAAFGAQDEATARPKRPMANRILT